MGDRYAPVWCFLAGVALLVAFRFGGEIQRRADAASIQAAALQVQEMMDAMEDAKEQLEQTTREYRGYSQAVVR